MSPQSKSSQNQIGHGCLVALATVAIMVTFLAGSLISVIFGFIIVCRICILESKPFETERERDRTARGVIVVVILCLLFPFLHFAACSQQQNDDRYYDNGNQNVHLICSTFWSFFLFISNALASLLWVVLGTSIGSIQVVDTTLPQDDDFSTVAMELAERRAPESPENQPETVSATTRESKKKNKTKPNPGEKVSLIEGAKNASTEIV